jgi:hypothetical protein
MTEPGASDPAEVIVLGAQPSGILPAFRRQWPRILVNSRCPEITSHSEEEGTR